MWLVAIIVLQSPGKCFSVKGRIREIDGEFVFDLHKYTTQVY